VRVTPYVLLSVVRCSEDETQTPSRNRTASEMRQTGHLLPHSLRAYRAYQMPAQGLSDLCLLAQTRDTSLSEWARWILEEHMRELHDSSDQLHDNSTNHMYDWIGSTARGSVPALLDLGRGSRIGMVLMVTGPALPMGCPPSFALAYETRTCKESPTIKTRRPKVCQSALERRVIQARMMLCECVCGRLWWPI